MSKHIKTTLIGVTMIAASAGCGKNESPQKPTLPERRADVAAQWRERDAVKARGGNPNNHSPREDLVDKLALDPELLPDGASKTLINKIFGPPLPERSNRSVWRYLTVRYTPANAFSGEKCERY